MDQTTTLADAWRGIELPPRRPARPPSQATRVVVRGAPYLMLAPAVVIVLVLGAYPLLASLRLALERRSGLVSTWVGFDNYAQLLHDSEFWHALETTLVFTASAVTIEALLGLGLALIVAAHDTSWVRRLRVVYLMPMIVAPVLVGIVWRLIYAADVGPLPYLASQVGIHLDVLSSESLALPALIAVDVWEWTPFVFLLLLAGLNSLPTEPFEAAQVDGAGRGRIFATLTLPMLRPVLLAVLLVRAIDCFSVFDQVFVLTRGGPGAATQVAGMYAYDTAFQFGQVGYGAAIVAAMLLALVIIAALLVAALRRRTA